MEARRGEMTILLYSWSSMPWMMPSAGSQEPAEQCKRREEPEKKSKGIRRRKVPRQDITNHLYLLTFPTLSPCLPYGTGQPYQGNLHLVLHLLSDAGLVTHHPLPSHPFPRVKRKHNPQVYQSFEREALPPPSFPFLRVTSIQELSRSSSLGTETPPTLYQTLCYPHPIPSQLHTSHKAPTSPPPPPPPPPLYSDATVGGSK